jgi:hypothetical protein
MLPAIAGMTDTCHKAQIFAVEMGSYWLGIGTLLISAFGVAWDDS